MMEKKITGYTNVNYLSNTTARGMEETQCEQIPVNCVSAANVRYGPSETPTYSL